MSALASLFVLAGCSSTAPHGDEPDVGGKKDAPPFEVPVCQVTEGDPDVIPDSANGVWWQDGGSMRCVVSTDPPPESGGDGFAATRDEAVALAAGRLLPGAFEMLERRGVTLSPVRQEETADGFADAVARGASSAFPRIAIREAVVEQCETSGGGEHWRARLFAEYPIGVLRGDATNAQWEKRRLVRELRMRVESAEALLADGRWMEAVFQMKIAQQLLLRVEPGPACADIAARVQDVFSNEEGPFAPRFVQVENRGPVVVPAGGRVPVRYRLEYRMGDAWMPASGVPVRIDGGNLVRPVAGATETNAFGEIAFDVAAGSEAGDDSLRVTAELFPRLQMLLPYGRRNGATGIVATVVQDVVVLSTRETSVCLEVHAGGESNAARVREGVASGLDAIGSSLVECGPGASLVVSADVSLTTREAHGAYLARAFCEVRVFDQRLAEKAGEIAFEVEESLESTARDAEVLVLREVGRLITVYLEPRLAER